MRGINVVRRGKYRQQNRTRKTKQTNKQTNRDHYEPKSLRVMWVHYAATSLDYYNQTGEEKRRRVSLAISERNYETPVLRKS